MLTRTRSRGRLSNALSDGENKPTKRTVPKRKNNDDIENLPSPPSTPSKRNKPETPQNVRHITKEFQLAQLNSPINRTVYLKSMGLSEDKVKGKKQDLYQKAKAVFRRTALPSRLVGRGDERQTLLDFWRNHVIANKPGCLYISGMPGTGKTAMLNETMRRTEDETIALRSHQVKTVVINCMSVREPKQIYQKLIEELAPTATIQTDVVKQAQELVNAKKNILNVVVLDEIDSLITREQDVLYKIFEWASLPSSRLVLIGIANALDLTDRILPRLRAKNCEPQLLNFNPYQVNEIKEIIRDRLFSLVEDPDNPFGPPPKPAEGAQPPLIPDHAIELCARKVAHSMGDLRTALDICRQATELAEMDHKKRSGTAVLGENGSTKAPAEPKVTVVHVMKVLNLVFGNSTTQKLKQLNLQQKIVLGVMIITIRQFGKKALTIGKFREQYRALCSDSLTMVSAVSRTELNDLLSGLETTSIISLSKSKEETARKIQINVQETEIVQMIQDMPILKTWMDQVLLEH